jgi:putative FmdB family regulatory protein
MYEFECQDCYLTFTIRATIQQKEAGLRLECPQCRGHSIRQVISAGMLLSSRPGPSAGPGCGPNAKKGCCG